MNQELKKITTWLTANRLSLNINKTNFIIFKRNAKKLKNKANVIINEHIIENFWEYTLMKNSLGSIILTILQVKFLR